MTRLAARPRVSLGLTLAALGAWTVIGIARADQDVLRFGLSSTLLEDVNRTDALAAMTVWLKGVGVAAGTWKGAEGRVFDDAGELVREVAAERIDLFALSSIEYLAVERSVPADPSMVYVVGGEVEIEYVLLARAEIRDLKDAEGKRLLVFNASGQPTIAEAWLDVLLAEHRLPDRARAFPKAQLVTKASQAILPLFFGRADVALVTRSAFETAAELNPQVGKQLVVLARSPRLLPGLICVRRTLSPDLRRRYVDQAVTIHEWPQFRQTFLVLRMNRFGRWEPRYLDAARALLARRQAVKRTAVTAR